MGKKVRQLRSLIYGNYDTEADFARAIGWERQKLSKITNGVKVPDIDELNQLARGLDRPIEEIVNIFLLKMSPNEQQNSPKAG